MKLLAYDTETTGIPDYHSPSDGETQPHLVQLGSVLIDSDTKEELHATNFLIRPDGWEITPEMTAIHGITHERAMDEGIPEADATRVYQQLLNQADLRIGHNL